MTRTEQLQAEIDRLKRENAELRIGTPAELAALPARKPKGIRYDEIKAKGWTQYGVKHEGEVLKGAKAVVVPGKSIRIYGLDHNHVNGPVAYDKVFRIGDSAEYDSYNLHYFGTIINIGKKTVTIEAHDRKRRLDLYSFCWRNQKDAKRKHEANANWMD